MALKVTAFVPVRLTSSRLPHKHLRMIGERPLLSWVLNRLKGTNQIDEIVVCAPDEKESLALEEICRREGVGIYIHTGNANDVVGRLIAAAEKHSADVCVLASGDCPLLVSSSIDKLIQAIKENDGAAIAQFSAREGMMPIHEGLLVTTRAVWVHADALSATPELREHQFPVLWMSPERFSHFKTISMQDEAVYYRLKHRISVDTPADLMFHRQIYSFLEHAGKEYALHNAIAVMEENPWLLDENRHVRQKGYADKNYKVMFLGDSASGHANHARPESFLLADRLVHEFSCGVEFLVLDSETRTMLEQQHYVANVVDAISFSDLERLMGFDWLVVGKEAIDQFPAALREKLFLLSDRIVDIDVFKNRILPYMNEARSSV